MKPSKRLRLAFFLLASISLAGCASGPDTAANLSAHIADMPHWMGGFAAGCAPRAGTPEYDAWQAERAKEAARLKSA
jgi:hypothetical protein